MVRTLIQSNDCVFQIDMGSGFVDFLCFKSFTVNIVTDEKEITTVGDGMYKSFDYRVLSYTVNLNGGMRIPDSVVPTNFDLTQYQLGFLPVPFRCIYEDSNGDLRYIAGTAIVKNSNLLASASQIADATIDLLGDGALELGDSLQTFVNLTLQMTGADSETALVKFRLQDSNGDVIFRSDTLPQASGGNLSNPFNITTSIPSGTYYIYWWVQSNMVGNQFDLNAPPTLTSFFNNGTVVYSSFGVQQFDFTANRTAVWTLGIGSQPPTCVPPAIVSGLNNPSTSTGTPWTGIVTLSGSQPFNITNVVMPAGMTISLSGNTVTFNWPSPVQGLNQDISFDATNACGTVSYADEIDVIANPNSVNIVWNYTEPGTLPASACVARLYVNATLFGTFTVTGSTSLTVIPGDVIEVQVSGPGLAAKRIEVIDSVAGEIYDITTFGLTHAFSFTTTLGHDYTINTSASNS